MMSATIDKTVAVSGAVVPFERGRRRLVTAFPLPASARTRLSELLVGDLELIDIRDADGTEGLVIVPSVSRQLIGKLGAASPAARVIVTELEDVEHCVRLGGPVSPALEGDEDGCYVAGSIEQFATLERGRDSAKLAW